MTAVTRADLIIIASSQGAPVGPNLWLQASAFPVSTFNCTIELLQTTHVSVLTVKINPNRRVKSNVHFFDLTHLFQDSGNAGKKTLLVF